MYKAILFTPEGDAWVTYYNRCKSINEVEECLANMGSTWFFYPFHFVITDNGKSYTTDTQRIVSTPEGMEYLKGRTIRKVAKHLSTGVEGFRLV